MDWTYFELVALTHSDGFKMVEENGEPFIEDGSLVYFSSFEQAEDYLVENDIRGTIR